MSEAEFPPSLAVITDAAVAVGHRRQSMAVSTRICMLYGMSLMNVIDSESVMNGSNWNANSHRCHREGLSSLTRTLQKATKSMAKNYLSGFGNLNIMKYSKHFLSLFMTNKKRMK